MSPIWLVNLSALPASNRIEFGRREVKSGARLKIAEENSGRMDWNELRENRKLYRERLEPERDPRRG
jgi:hypothetical protein